MPSKLKDLDDLISEEASDWVSQWVSEEKLTYRDATQNGSRYIVRSNNIDKDIYTYNA